MEKSFLYYDDDGDVENLKIVGNEAGLLKLKQVIEVALKNKNTSSRVEIDQGLPCIIECSDSYERSHEKPTSLFQRAGAILIGLLLAIWFFVLPFVAVGYLVNDSFFDEGSTHQFKEACKFPDCIAPLRPLEFEQKTKQINMIAIQSAYFG